MRNYGDSKASQPRKPAELIKFIVGWPKVVIYGAGALGQAVRSKLFDLGILCAGYWDLRHADMGKGVVKPYGLGNPDDTLVIVCIGNTIYQPEIAKELETHGYSYIFGDLVYQDLVCPMNEETGINAEACLRGPCRAIYCRKLSDIVKDQNSTKATVPLFLHSVTVVVNQVCSLSCKYCTSYMNQYPAHDRINFPKEQVISNIKRFFGAVDGVGTITVMGGEPFLHPDLSDIVQAILDCGNFGVISISTSGTCKIKRNQLASLRDKRVNVSFSNYLDQLTEKQQAFFHSNVGLLKSMDIPHTIGAPGPMWVVPSTLDVGDSSIDTLQKRKLDCDPVRCPQIKNGVLYPCDLIQSVHGLELGDYPDSFVSLDGTGLRHDIERFMAQTFYRACERCKGNQGTTSAAGEQGYINLLGVEA